MEDYGYKHTCVSCNKEIKSEKELGALIVGRGLECKECEDRYWEDVDGCEGLDFVAIGQREEGEEEKNLNGLV